MNNILQDLRNAANELDLHRANQAKSKPGMASIIDAEATMALVTIPKNADHIKIDRDMDWQLTYSINGRGAFCCSIIGATADWGKWKVLTIWENHTDLEHNILFLKKK